jgi:hypothetical protein
MGPFSAPVDVATDLLPAVGADFNQQAERISFNNMNDLLAQSTPK